MEPSDDLSPLDIEARAQRNAWHTERKSRKGAREKPGWEQSAKGQERECLVAVVKGCQKGIQNQAPNVHPAYNQTCAEFIAIIVVAFLLADQNGKDPILFAWQAFCEAAETLPGLNIAQIASSSDEMEASWASASLAGCLHARTLTFSRVQNALRELAPSQKGLSDLLLSELLSLGPMALAQMMPGESLEDLRDRALDFLTGQAGAWNHEKQWPRDRETDELIERQGDTSLDPQEMLRAKLEEERQDRITRFHARLTPREREFIDVVDRLRREREAVDDPTPITDAEIARYMRPGRNGQPVTAGTIPNWRSRIKKRWTDTA